jgi:hypothetical protein
MLNRVYGGTLLLEDFVDDDGNIHHFWMSLSYC